MKKEQFKEIASAIVPNVDAMASVLEKNHIESARLYFTSEGYLSFEFKDNDSMVELMRLKADEKITLKVSEKL